MNSQRSKSTSVKFKRFLTAKHQLPKAKFENKPLISKDLKYCSDSDEEITIHDIRYLKNEPIKENHGHNLRKIKKQGTSNSNGDTTECKKTLDPFKNCDFLYWEIQEGDTLQSISIRYQCSISDIKRANNLMTNQDFYGLKHIKIPVKKFSLLSEILPSAPETTPSASIIVEENESDTRTIPIGIGTAGRCPSPQDSAAFFKRMDEDLVKIMLSTNSQKESLEAAAVALTTPQIHPLVKDAVDCQWNYLVVIILVVAVVIPLLLYLYMRSSHDHHAVVYPSTSTSEAVSVDRPG